MWQLTVQYWPSVLWRCWLGDRKGIRPVKNWVVGRWHGYLSGARCRLAYGPADATATHYLLLQWNPDWFTCLVPAHPGSPGKRVVKCVCVTVKYTSHTFSFIFRQHRMHGLQRSAHGLWLQMLHGPSVRWSQACAVLKQLNQSRCCLGPRNHAVGGGLEPPGKGQFWGHLSAHCEVQIISSMSQRYLVGGCSNMACH